MVTVYLLIGWAAGILTPFAVLAMIFAHMRWKQFIKDRRKKYYYYGKIRGL